MEKALSPAASWTRATHVATANMLTGTHLCNSVNWDFMASPSVFQIINNGINITNVVVKR